MIFKKHKIAIVGTGNIGSAIYKMLPEGSAICIGEDNSADVKIDAKNFNDLEKYFKENNISAVINAGPYYICESVAKAALWANIHYLDLTEDNEQTEKVINVSLSSNKSVFIPKCGLAPGAINIITKHLYNQFDQVHDLKMYVGALPKYPTNELKYNVTWSVDGVLNEYQKDSLIIENGKLKSVPSLEGIEAVIIDGVEYEAFHTSGGLGTLYDSICPKNMVYKTLRYPGHAKLMKFLFDFHKFDLYFKDHFLSYCPPTDQDIVIIHVSVTGKINGRYQQKVISKKIENENGFTAIQRATASGVLAVLELLLKGKLGDNKFVKQEQISYSDFINTCYGNIYGY